MTGVRVFGLSRRQTMLVMVGVIMAAIVVMPLRFATALAGPGETLSSVP